MPPPEPETRPLLPILDLEGDLPSSPIRGRDDAPTAAFFCVCVPLVVLIVGVLGVVCLRIFTF